MRGKGATADANTGGHASKRWKLLIMQGAECLQLQQEQGSLRQRERELGEEVEMLKIKLVLQQQRSEAELQNAKGSYEASLAYLESRARATLGRLAERVKVCFAPIFLAANAVSHYLCP